MPAAIYPRSTNLEVRPLPASLQKDSRIGAEVHFRGAADSSDPPRLVTPAALDDSDKKLLQTALWEHSVLVFKKQKGIHPSVLSELAGVWDDKVKDTHSAGEKMVTDKDNILSRNGGNRIPRAPMVSILGSGRFENYESIPELNLRHVNQKEFHSKPLSDEEVAAGQTRFYRWHMDMPLHRRLPGRVTLIHGLVIPKGLDQRVVFDEGDELSLAPGATAFISGSRAFDNLSPSEQEWALNTTVQYAPRAYEWIRDCRATSDGLTIDSAGQERPLSDLPEWTWSDSQIHPMVWKHPLYPDRPLLQIVGCCVYALRTTDPATGVVTEITDIRLVREKIRSLMKKTVRPQYIYAHAWEEGDLVVFHNKGVWHSITGNLDDQRRLLWQCTMESAERPEAAQPLPKS
ncbi:putative dioxygenase [Ceratocystis platani]|uniref:Putative dioxygenase n=1 Tax=Ceratocystis fimbriata f. sp. platani TaxID=88771 RepID=A0A0F8CNK8_CERFI|nr:putative dioxygenase [Ceratocystis platani]